MRSGSLLGDILLFYCFRAPWGWQTASLKEKRGGIPLMMEQPG